MEPHRGSARKPPGKRPEAGERAVGMLLVEPPDRVGYERVRIARREAGSGRELLSR
jgi:hypothetical protein